jgi:hypothetical protein
MVPDFLLPFFLSADMLFVFFLKQPPSGTLWCVLNLRIISVSWKLRFQLQELEMNNAREQRRRKEKWGDE